MVQNANELMALIGLGILSQNQPGVSGLRAIGSGGLGGLQAFNQLQSGRQNQDLRAAQLAQAQAQTAALERQEEQKRAQAQALESLLASPGGPGAQLASNPSFNPDLARAFPSQVADALVSQAFPPPQRPVPVGAGGALIDPRTGQVIASRAPNAPRPVPLGPGGSLVDPLTGNTIASREPRPQRPVPIPAGGSLVDPTTGAEIASRAPRPVSVAPGGALVDPQTGETVASRPPRLRRPSAQDAKIGEIMSTWNVDRKTASGIATGVIQPIQNPVTGETDLLNMVDGTSRKVERGGPPPTPTPVPRRTLWDRAGEVTGFAPAAEELGQRLGGQIPGLDPGTSQTTQSRQTFRTEQGNLVRALSINPRFPVAEINRIREETNIAPALFDSESSLRDRMVAVDGSLGVREQRERQAAADTTLPADTRQAAAQSARDIANFRATLGVPPLITSDDQFDQLESGTEFRTEDGKTRIKP